MSYSPWKVHERAVAKALRGYRIPRGANFSESLPDVVSNYLTTHTILAECKHFKYRAIYDSLKEELEYNSFLYSKENGYVFFNIKDIDILLSFAQDNCFILENKIPKYIVDFFKQATEYIPDLFSNNKKKFMLENYLGENIIYDKILPIVCLGQKKSSTIICYTHIDYLHDKNKRKTSIL